MPSKGSDPYTSDVTDEEWWFVLPYLLLCREDSRQRKHDLQTVFNAVRYVGRTGGQWRYPTRNRQAPHGQTRLRPAAQMMGCRTQLRLGSTIQKTRQRLRKTRHHPQRPKLHRVRHPHDYKTYQHGNDKCLKASRGHRPAQGRTLIKNHFVKLLV
jgi:transposase